MIGAAAMTNAMVLASVATTASGSVTQVLNNVSQIHQGWLQVDLKQADMAAQIPGHITPPPIQHP
jgi:hypothetical protein